MFKYITTTKKKWFLLLTTTIVLTLALIQAQINLTQVSADVIPISVNIDELDFGQVFPGENSDKSFTVTYTDEIGQSVVYTIIQKIKPLPNVVVPDGYSGTVSQYCQDNPTDYSRCYRNLCPYITKISQDNEADTESGAEVGPSDTIDNWLVNLSVPAIIGQVAQDHDGGIVSSNGDYGCDISLNVD